MTRSPVLVVGVSGATWDVVEPLVAAGRLPRLARLRARGAWCTLRSVRVEGDDHVRPQPAWATAATGCRPERHGVTRYFHEADELREPTLWELWERQGLTVGLFGWQKYTSVTGAGSCAARRIAATSCA